MKYVLSLVLLCLGFCGLCVGGDIEFEYPTLVMPTMSTGQSQSVSYTLENNSDSAIYIWDIVTNTDLLVISSSSYVGEIVQPGNSLSLSGTLYAGNDQMEEYQARLTVLLNGYNGPFVRSVRSGTVSGIGSPSPVVGTHYGIPAGAPPGDPNTACCFNFFENAAFDCYPVYSDSDNATRTCMDIGTHRAYLITPSAFGDDSCVCSKVDTSQYGACCSYGAPHCSGSTRDLCDCRLTMKAECHEFLVEEDIPIYSFRATKPCLRDGWYGGQCFADYCPDCGTCCAFQGNTWSPYTCIPGTRNEEGSCGVVDSWYESGQHLCTAPADFSAIPSKAPCAGLCCNTAHSNHTYWDGELCVNTNLWWCLSEFGEFHANEDDCTEIDCEFRPCCPSDGSACAMMTEDDCSAAGDLWFSAETSCDDVVCANQLGACCNWNEVTEVYDCIDDVYRYACSDDYDVWKGYDVTCVDVVCPPKYACCNKNSLETDWWEDPLNPGEYLDCKQAYNPVCVANGGEWHENYNCPGFGGSEISCEYRPCCLDNGSCIVLLETQCIELMGVWDDTHDLCSEVECPGICCDYIPTLDTYMCRESWTSDECNSNGDYFMEAISCSTPSMCMAPTAACCNVSGVVGAPFYGANCADLTEKACSDYGGHWWPGKLCSEAECEVEACCLPGDGECEVITNEECLSRDGVVRDGIITCGAADCDRLNCCVLPETVGPVECLAVYSDVLCSEYYGSHRAKINPEDCSLCESLGACCSKWWSFSLYRVLGWPPEWPWIERGQCGCELTYGASECMDLDGGNIFHLGKPCKTAGDEIYCDGCVECCRDSWHVCGVSGYEECIAGEYPNSGAVLPDGTCQGDFRCTGACCNNLYRLSRIGFCDETTASYCNLIDLHSHQPSGTWHGYNSDCDDIYCPHVEVCCLPDGTCQHTDIAGAGAECEAVGGQSVGFAGTTHNCDDLEVYPCLAPCCAGGLCYETDPIDCEVAGGEWGYPQQECDDIDCCGVCCEPDGTCNVTSNEYDCINLLGGDWAPPETDNCDVCELGACCKFDDTCVLTNLLNCPRDVGVFVPGASSCDACDRGACCNTSDGSCRDWPEVVAGLCTGANEVWRGGLTCAFDADGRIRNPCTIGCACYDCTDPTSATMDRYTFYTTIVSAYPGGSFFSEKVGSNYYPCDVLYAETGLFCGACCNSIGWTHPCTVWLVKLEGWELVCDPYAGADLVPADGLKCDYGGSMCFCPD